MEEEITEGIKKCIDELDMMLEAHEKFKEEYGKKYEGLSEQERMEEYKKQLEQVQGFLKESGMKTEKFNPKKE